MTPPASPQPLARRHPRDGARVDLTCSTCSYGVVVRIAPDRCPMCGSTVWEHVRA